MAAPKTPKYTPTSAVAKPKNWHKNDLNALKIASSAVKNLSSYSQRAIAATVIAAFVVAIEVATVVVVMFHYKVTSLGYLLACIFLGGLLNSNKDKLDKWILGENVPSNR